MSDASVLAPKSFQERSLKDNGDNTTQMSKVEEKHTVTDQEFTSMLLKSAGIIMFLVLILFLYLVVS